MFSYAFITSLKNERKLFNFKLFANKCLLKKNNVSDTKENIVIFLALIPRNAKCFRMQKENMYLFFLPNSKKAVFAVVHSL